MDLRKRFVELWEKWLQYVVLVLLCAVLLYSVVYCLSALFRRSGGLHIPCIMYEDRLYLCHSLEEPRLPEKAVFCGRIENSVGEWEWPKENFQSDRPWWDGKDIYWISENRIAIETDKGWLYFDKETEE